MGQIDKAREIASKLLTTHPEAAQETNQFLEELNHLQPK